MMEDRLNKALEHESWQTREIKTLRDTIVIRDEKIIELKRDIQWLRNLCAEQSSSIAGYMRSR